MDSNDSFVVFYSNYCDHSKEFLVKLRNMKNGLFEKFTKICVDNNNSIPKSINSVPTLLVPNHPYPLTDNDVFMWLDSMSSQYTSNQGFDGREIQTQGEMPMPEQVDNRTNINNQLPNNPSQTTNNDENEGVAPYVAGEMGNCFSDSFSFLDEDPLGGQPLAHTFTFIGDCEPSTMSSNPSEIDRPHVTNNQKATSGFDVAYEQYMSNRDGDPQISQVPKRAG